MQLKKSGKNEQDLNFKWAKACSVPAGNIYLLSDWTVLPLADDMQTAQSVQRSDVIQLATRKQTTHSGNSQASNTNTDYKHPQYRNNVCILQHSIRCTSICSTGVFSSFCSIGRSLAENVVTSPSTNCDA